MEVLFSYYYNENEIVFPSNSLFEDSDDESDDDDNNNKNNQSLTTKYSFITNNTDVECNFCLEEFNINFYKCDQCIFKICLDCYDKYNKKTCPMCKN